MTGLDSVCFASGFILFRLKRCKDFSSVCVCVGGAGVRGGGGGVNKCYKEAKYRQSVVFLACAYLESCKPRSRK